MQIINGIVWLFVPSTITFFCLWKIAEREANHYKSLFIKTNSKLTYIEYDMSNKKWDDNYQEEKK
jgi:hypothetical protein